MALQRNGNRVTMPIDGAPAVPVLANLIVVRSATGAAVSTAGQQGFLGVTVEPSDPSGYTGIQLDFIVQITAGANITSGQEVCSNAVGQAVPAFISSSGTPVQQVVGTAMNTALSGNLVDVLLNPSLVN